MKQKDLIKLARHAIYKGWDYEQLKYSDDLYGKEDLAGLVWVYVEECLEIGTVKWISKYKKQLD